MDPVILRLLGVLEQMHEDKGVPKQDNLVDKNIIKSNNSTLGGNKKEKSGLSSSQKKNLAETFNLFNEMFFNYQKKMKVDEKEKTKVSQIVKKQVTPPPIPTKKSDGGKLGLGGILGGLLLLAGGLAALVTGLMTNGPFKGILKMLSRFGIKGGIKLLTKAIKPFLEIAGKILKTPLQFLGKIGKFLGEGFAKVGKFLFGGISKMAGKAFGKIGGGSIGKMLMKFIKPLAKVFKRIPIIGTILSIAFAYTRFKSGDVVGGVIDVLSGLAGLVDIVLPGVGTTMSIGLDVLNAVLDSKADQGEGNPKKSKMTILKDMASSVGTWIWSKRMYIPILSSVNRFMMSWEAFKSGDLSGGFSNFGLALSNLVTGVDGGVIMDGISGFMGLFEGSSGGNESMPKPNNSFISEMAGVVGEKIKELWAWLKQKIKDGIAGLIPGGKAVMEFANDTAAATKELTGHISAKAKNIYNSAKESFSEIDGIYQTFNKKGAEKLNSFTDGVWNYFKTPNKSKPSNPDSVLVKTKTTPKPSNPDSVLVKTKTTPKPSNPDSATPEIKKEFNFIRDDQSIAKAFYKLQAESAQYLKIIAVNTTNLIAKIDKIGNNTSSNSTTTFISPPSPAPKTPSISIDNNRMGFAGSPYSLA